MRQTIRFPFGNSIQFRRRYSKTIFANDCIPVAADARLSDAGQESDCVVGCRHGCGSAQIPLVDWLSQIHFPQCTRDRAPCSTATKTAIDSPDSRRSMSSGCYCSHLTFAIWNL